MYLQILTQFVDSFKFSHVGKYQSPTILQTKVSSYCLPKTVFTFNTAVVTTVKPHSHCAGVATVHPDAGQPVYRDAPGHIS